jgi:hypothetical protein
LPAEFGKPDTVSRYFRRLTHAGLWRKLVEELVELPAEHPLQTLASWICRACRRARRLLGLRMIFLLRRLNLRSALWAPPWLLPDRDLSETLRTHVLAMFRDRAPGQPPPSRGWFRAMRWLHRAAGGRTAIPRAVQEAWC